MLKFPVINYHFLTASKISADIKIIIKPMYNIKNLRG
jgi:hypothetical protein